MTGQSRSCTSATTPAACAAAGTKGARRYPSFTPRSVGRSPTGTLTDVTDAEGALPRDVAEALLAIQRLVNDLVDKAGAVRVPSGTAFGSWHVTGTAIGVAPALTPDRVEALRGWVEQARDGAIVVAVSVDVLEGLLSFAERVADLLP